MQENPSKIYKYDYFSDSVKNGRQIMSERFDLSVRDDQGASRAQSSGMVFVISESCFPHQFNFLLLEPCSHIFWQHTLSDDKLNPIDSRQDKQAFAWLLLK